MSDLKLTIVRVGSGLLGIVALISGGKAIIQGLAGKLGEQAANLDTAILASADNEFRFFAATWFLVGIALLIGAIKIHAKPDLVQIGLEAVILGGLVRLFAFKDYGVVDSAVPAIAIEIIAGGILFALFIMWRRSSKI